MHTILQKQLSFVQIAEKITSFETEIKDEQKQHIVRISRRSIENIKEKFTKIKKGINTIPH